MKRQLGYTLNEIIIVVCMLAAVGLVGGVIYTAIHFIAARLFVMSASNRASAGRRKTGARCRRPRTRTPRSTLAAPQTRRRRPSRKAGVPGGA